MEFSNFKSENEKTALLSKLTIPATFVERRDKISAEHFNCRSGVDWECQGRTDKNIMVSFPRYSQLEADYIEYEASKYVDCVHYRNNLFYISHIWLYHSWLIDISIEKPL